MGEPVHTVNEFCRCIGRHSTHEHASAAVDAASRLGKVRKEYGERRGAVQGSSR